MFEDKDWNDVARILGLSDEERKVFNRVVALADRWAILFRLAEESRLITSTPTKRKRSTERGEARVKLIAALTKHHQYANGGCLNLEPIGCNELARMAGVSSGSASAFFAKEFGGYGKYRTLCGNADELTASLKRLNRDKIGTVLENTGKTGVFDQSDVERSALAAREAPLDPELAAVVDAWPALPAAIKAGILATIRAP